LGPHQIRVLKAATTKVAQGISTPATTTVTVPPIPALIVGTTALPDAVVESSYAVQLAATGGVPPYTWSASGLPAGLTLSSAGVLSGRVGSIGTTTTTVTVTDARLVAASAALTLRASLSAQAVDLGHAWGSNGSGALGINQGSGADVAWPEAIGLAGLTQIAPLSSGAVGLRFNGDVWAWGSNGAGTFGVSPGTLASSVVPVQVPGLHDVTAVAAGATAAYALAPNGTVWAWGYNASGQLGNGTIVGAATPVPAQVLGLSGVTAIASSASTGYALKQDGTVWAWGYNVYGQLGDGTTTNRPTAAPVPGLSGITEISGNSNGQQLEALRSDGTVWMLGRNSAGELGDGTTNDAHTPLQVPGLSHVTQVSSAGNASFALVAGGTVMGWGSNSGGQVGDGTIIDRLSPVPVRVTGAVEVCGGGQASFAVLADGTAVGWGFNANSEVGDGTTTSRPSPVPIPGLTRVRQITGSTFSSYAVTGS
jgi:alpha-tubulin suppressor-like RCC1 family protein